MTQAPSRGHQPSYDGIIMVLNVLRLNFLNNKNIVDQTSCEFF